jgi:NAD+ kinase
LSEPLVVVVEKRTAYRRFVVDERDPRARALLRRRSPAVNNWIDSHNEHMRTLEHVHQTLTNAGVRTLQVQRAHAVFDTSDAALVIAVGGDGTLLAASHSVASTPILGVNSAPKHSVGFFCAARRTTFAKMLDQALTERLASVELTRMSVTVNGRIRAKRVLNEALYCHASPAGTSRYILTHGRKSEEQRSSGFWIGPAAGSTAAQRSAGGKVLPLSSAALQLVVREPYDVGSRKSALVRALIAEGDTLVSESKMDNACVFMDGQHWRIPVRLGDRVGFRASDEPLTVLGLARRRG